MATYPPSEAQQAVGVLQQAAYNDAVARLHEIEELWAAYEGWQGYIPDQASVAILRPLIDFIVDVLHPENMRTALGGAVSVQTAVASGLSLRGARQALDLVWRPVDFDKFVVAALDAVRVTLPLHPYAKLPSLFLWPVVVREAGVMARSATVAPGGPWRPLYIQANLAQRLQCEVRSREALVVHRARGGAEAEIELPIPPPPGLFKVFFPDDRVQLPAERAGLPEIEKYKRYVAAIPAIALDEYGIGNRQTGHINHVIHAEDIAADRAFEISWSSATQNTNPPVEPSRPAFVEEALAAWLQLKRHLNGDPCGPDIAWAVRSIQTQTRVILIETSAAADAVAAPFAACVVQLASSAGLTQNHVAKRWASLLRIPFADAVAAAQPRVVLYLTPTAAGVFAVDRRLAAVAPGVTTCVCTSADGILALNDSLKIALSISNPPTLVAIVAPISCAEVIAEGLLPCAAGALEAFALWDVHRYNLHMPESFERAVCVIELLRKRPRERAELEGVRCTVDVPAVVCFTPVCSPYLASLVHDVVNSASEYEMFDYHRVALTSKLRMCRIESVLLPALTQDIVGQHAVAAAIFGFIDEHPAASNGVVLVTLPEDASGDTAKALDIALSAVNVRRAMEHHPRFVGHGLKALEVPSPRSLVVLSALDALDADSLDISMIISLDVYSDPAINVGLMHLTRTAAPSAVLFALPVGVAATRLDSYTAALNAGLGAAGHLAPPAGVDAGIWKARLADLALQLYWARDPFCLCVSLLLASHRGIGHSQAYVCPRGALCRAHGLPPNLPPVDNVAAAQAACAIAGMYNCFSGPNFTLLGNLNFSAAPGEVQDLIKWLRNQYTAPPRSILLRDTVTTDFSMWSPIHLIERLQKDAANTPKGVDSLRLFARSYGVWASAVAAVVVAASSLDGVRLVLPAGSEVMPVVRPTHALNNLATAVQEFGGLNQRVGRAQDMPRVRSILSDDPCVSAIQRQPHGQPLAKATSVTADLKLWGGRGGGGAAAAGHGAAGGSV